MHAATVSLIADGTVEAFDTARKTAIAQSVVDAMDGDITLSDVTVFVEAASVRITIEIYQPDAAASAAVAASLLPHVGTASAASTLLDLTVTASPAIDTVTRQVATPLPPPAADAPTPPQQLSPPSTSPPAELPPAESGASDDSTMLLVAIGGGSAVLVFALFAVACCVCAPKKDAAAGRSDSYIPSASSHSGTNSNTRGPTMGPTQLRMPTDPFPNVTSASAASARMSDVTRASVGRRSSADRERISVSGHV